MYHFWYFHFFQQHSPLDRDKPLLHYIEVELNYGRRAVNSSAVTSFGYTHAPRSMGCWCVTGVRDTSQNAFGHTRDLDATCSSQINRINVVLSHGNQNPSSDTEGLHIISSTELSRWDLIWRGLFHSIQPVSDASDPTVARDFSCSWRCFSRSSI